MTEIIHKEHFEHWLFSQEDARTFDYSNAFECMGCSFVKETMLNKRPRFLMSTWSTDDGLGPEASIPEFLRRLLRQVTIYNGHVFTIAQAKAAWLKLFPETEVNIQPAQAVKGVK